MSGWDRFDCTFIIDCSRGHDFPVFGVDLGGGSDRRRPVVGSIATRHLYIDCIHSNHRHLVSAGEPRVSHIQG